MEGSASTPRGAWKMEVMAEIAGVHSRSQKEQLCVRRGIVHKRWRPLWARRQCRTGLRKRAKEIGPEWADDCSIKRRGTRALG